MIGFINLTFNLIIMRLSVQDLAQKHKWIRDVLVLSGACPECYNFSRDIDNLESRLLPSEEWIIEYSVQEVTNHETCKNCGHDFGVVKHSYPVGRYLYPRSYDCF